MAAEQLIEARQKYYILATEAPIAERTYVIKRGDTFAVFSGLGDIDAEARIRRRPLSRRNAFSIVLQADTGFAQTVAAELDRPPRQRRDVGRPYQSRSLRGWAAGNAAKHAPHQPHAAYLARCLL